LAQEKAFLMAFEWANEMVRQKACAWENGWGYEWETEKACAWANEVVRQKACALGIAWGCASVVGSEL
jgi:hypothetical protein